MILPSVKQCGLATFDHPGNTVTASNGPRAADDAEHLRTRCSVTTEAATGTEVHAAEMALATSDRDPCKRSLTTPVAVDGVSSGAGEVDQPHPSSLAPAWQTFISWRSCLRRAGRGFRRLRHARLRLRFKLEEIKRSTPGDQIPVSTGPVTVSGLVTVSAVVSDTVDAFG